VEECDKDERQHVLHERYADALREPEPEKPDCPQLKLCEPLIEIEEVIH
jgi:hypothetical protein